MLRPNKSFAGSEEVWQKYCGFLDLSPREFMEIQEHLLLEEIELVAESPLGKKIMKGTRPKSVEEFRQLVPLTTYEDYAPDIGNCQEDALAEKPFCWAHTSGRGGTHKWVPYTRRAFDRLGISGMGMSILACASKKGEVRVGEGARFLQNLPPRPYYSGICFWSGQLQFGFRLIPPLEYAETLSFEERMQAGFGMALRTGVDVLSSLTSVLIKMGERFTETSGGSKPSWKMLHPLVMPRIIRALVKSKIEKRAILPKDLWPLKGLICYGMDTSIYKERLKYYWGKEPLEGYGSTEMGVVATQCWNKKGMTFFPFSCFLEFVPEEEWLKSRENKDYQPTTVLLDEVKEGKSYEVIITNFYGMPFLRYRGGDLIKIVASEDEETGVKIPQIAFESRADDLIDIAGFTRLDEKTVWQAIVNAGIRHEDWTIRKEYHLDQLILHLYIETKDDIDSKKAERLINKQLGSIDADYRDLQDMLGTQPLRVTLLPRGSFQRYYEEMRKAGADLAHMKPPHMNASEHAIQKLLHPD